MEDRISRLEAKLDIIGGQVQGLVGKAEMANTLIKLVIFPLILILGGLVGIKLVFPGT